MRFKFFKNTIWLLLAFCLNGCAFLHHYQVGEIDSSVVRQGRKFEILLSETGFNVREAAGIAQAVTQHQKTRQDIGQAAAIIELFQMGPRTGNPVFTDQFADHVVDMVIEKCPKGKVSGLASTRESAHYPVVSGEIVKITGYCLDKEGA